jgi:histidinol-phosphate aminotransferase
VKLNTNENPYGPSPRALAAIFEATSDSLRLYPDPTALRLRSAIARTLGLSPDLIFVGNGSDEVLGHSFAALLKHDAPLLFPDITYSFYPTYCRLFDVAYQQIPLDPAMQVRVADYRQPCGAVILANPNGPTGIALPRNDIEALLADHPDQVVAIDEAYVDFGAESAIPLVGRYPNLLVIRTFSKSHGLAGLRVGFAVGQRPLIEALERVKDSFNSYPLGRLAIVGATAAWEDHAWFEIHRDKVIATRKRLDAELRGLDFSVLPSSANFVFARHASHSGTELAAELRKLGILVRHFPKARIQHYLRITVGTDAECDRLIAALRKLTSPAPRAGSAPLFA